MGILDNARYAEIGKQAEAKSLADATVAAVAPHIEKEAVRKYAPIIEKQTVDKTLSMLRGVPQGSINSYGYFNNSDGLSRLQFK